MNRLKFNRGYLCGAMDRAADGGIGWRLNIQDELRDLDIVWLDPTNKPIQLGIEDLENRKYRNLCKETKNWEAVKNDMKIIRAVDLRMVDISDFLVVNIDPEIHACGTYEEFALANRQKKPIIVHVENGKEHCPDWLFGMIPHQMIFSTWEDVHKYLRHVAHDAVIEDFRRWYFFKFNLTRQP